MILETTEFDDGYYTEPKPTEIKAYCFDEWYKLNKGIYCDRCETLIQQEVIQQLKNIGFRKDGE